MVIVCGLDLDLRIIWTIGYQQIYLLLLIKIQRKKLDQLGFKLDNSIIDTYNRNKGGCLWNPENPHILSVLNLHYFTLKDSQLCLIISLQHYN